MLHRTQMVPRRFALDKPLLGNSRTLHKTMLEGLDLITADYLGRSASASCQSPFR